MQSPAPSIHNIEGTTFSDYTCLRHRLHAPNVDDPFNHSTDQFIHGEGRLTGRSCYGNNYILSPLAPSPGVTRVLRIMEGSEEALGLATNNDTGRGDLCPSIPKIFDADEDDIYW